MEKKETKKATEGKTANKKAETPKAKKTIKKARPKSAPGKKGNQVKKTVLNYEDVKIESGEEYETGVHEKKGKYVCFQLEKNKSMTNFANYFTLRKTDPSYIFSLYMYESGQTVIEINMKNKEKKDVIIDVNLQNNTRIRVLRQINPQIHKNYNKSFGEIMAEIG